jgi:nucleoside-diphosphate-sugar epimerase
MTALITGGAGFFGGVLTARLLATGEDCVVIDLQPTHFSHPRLTAVRADINDPSVLRRLFADYRFNTIYHCAAVLAHTARDHQFLWKANVDGTRAIAEAASRVGAHSVIFISTNCLWAQNLGRPVREDDVPAPIEVYGRSKWEAEKILNSYRADFNVIIIRCPTIVDEGRLGLLSILFEFIQEGRKVWVIDGGRNRYQFIYAQDLADACIRAAAYGRSETFNIGADEVASFRDIYQYVIDRAHTGARIVSIPRQPTLAAMRIAYALRLSPLGPYQYRMIAEDFAFDTTRIKQELGWRPTLSNKEMLWRAYEYYQLHREEIESREDASAHRQAAKMGAIRLLKWLS